MSQPVVVAQLDVLDALLAACDLVAVFPTMHSHLITEARVAAARLALIELRDKAWRYDELSR